MFKSLQDQIGAFFAGKIGKKQEKHCFSLTINTFVNSID